MPEPPPPEPPPFDILGPMRNVETIAHGRGVRIRFELNESHGRATWRKMKAIALIEDEHGWIGEAEIHWFEAHGIGRVRWKIKRRFPQR